MESSSKKIIKGGLIILISTVCVSIFSYLLRILLGRMLSLKDYGIIYSVRGFYGFLGIFIGLGLNSAVIKYVSEFLAKKDFKSIKSVIKISFYIQTFLAFIISGLSFIFSNYLSKSFFSYDVNHLIKIYSLIFLIFPTLNIIKAIFIGFHKSNFFALLEFIQSGIILFFSYFFLKLNLGNASYFWAVLIASFITIIIGWLLFWTKSFKKIFKTPNKKLTYLTKNMIVFGIAILISDLFIGMFGKVDSIVLTFFDSIENVGIYNIVLPTILALSNIFSSGMLIVLPVTSELWAKKEFSKLKQIVENLYHYILVFTPPLFLSVYLFSEEIILILFTSKFSNGFLAMKILSFAIPLIILFKINVSLIGGIGLQKKLGWIMPFSFLTNLILSIILVPLTGILGTAFSALISFILCNILLLKLIHKKIKVEFDYLSFFKVCFLSIIFFLSSVFLKKIFNYGLVINGILVVLISSVVYLFLCYLMKLINLKEIFEELIAVIK